MHEGEFVWYELLTSDVDAARTFYADVVGWTIVDSGMPHMRYLLAQVESRNVAGLMTFPPDSPGRSPAWLCHIAVEDVDAMAARIVAAGGAIERAAADIPGVGRFAVVSDPQGAVFTLFRGDGTPPPALAREVPGNVGWHELRTSDAEAAFPFYESLFGWTKAAANDMGAMGLYQTFDVHGAWVGGMMNLPQVPPHWAFYFNVDDIGSAVTRLVAAGGQVVNGPHEVPGGSWVVMATDPQGGHFALTSRADG